MKTIQGNYNKALVFTDSLENEAENQIMNFLNSKAFENSQIAIMPDVHSGKGSVIGLTMTLNDYIIPNVVGVDIGCGVLAYHLGKIDFSFEELDRFIRRNIPSGFEINDQVSDLIENSFIKKVQKISKKIGLETPKMLKAIGSLGGGNHYIEIDLDTQGNYWLNIHSGSRNFGLQIAEYHQKQAKNYCNKQKISVQKDLEFLPLNEGGADYLEDMKVAQEFADLNRHFMALKIIKKFFSLDFMKLRKVHSVHNFIDFTDRVIRKGAISSKKDEEIIIPLNMRDGAIIAQGKGSKKWNYSAPHGSGRIMSRNKAFKEIKLTDYKKSMEGIWSSCINSKTVDESPFAYKNPKDVLGAIDETAEIIIHLKPVYNFKSY